MRYVAAIKVHPARLVAPVDEQARELEPGDSIMDASAIMTDDQPRSSAHPINTGF